MWVLVLTIMLDGGVPRAVAIQTVDGFVDYKTCIAAGGKWGAAAIRRAPPGTQITAICLNKSGKQIDDPPPPLAPAPRP